MYWNSCEVWCLKWGVSQPRGRLWKTTAELSFFQSNFINLLNKHLPFGILTWGMEFFKSMLSRWASCLLISFDAVSLLNLRLPDICTFRRKPGTCSLSPQLHWITTLEEQLGEFSYSWGNKGLSWTFFMGSTFGWVLLPHIMHSYINKLSTWLKCIFILLLIGYYFTFLYFL
jgi:hypothetical protein